MVNLSGCVARHQRRYAEEMSSDVADTKVDTQGYEGGRHAQHSRDGLCAGHDTRTERRDAQ